MVSEDSSCSKPVIRPRFVEKANTSDASRASRASRPAIIAYFRTGSEKRARARDASRMRRGSHTLRRSSTRCSFVRGCPTLTWHPRRLGDLLGGPRDTPAVQASRKNGEKWRFLETKAPLFWDSKPAATDCNGFDGFIGQLHAGYALPLHVP